MRDFVTIGNRIKQKRKEMGCTQEEMSSAVGITSQYISMIENGKAQLSDRVMDNICQFLQCDASEINNGTTLTSNLYMVDEYVRLYALLTPENKRFLLDMLTSLVNNQSRD